MNLTLIVLFAATLIFAACFADAITRFACRLALAAGIVLLLRKPNDGLLNLLKASKLYFLRATPGRRTLIAYLIYNVALAAFWAYGTYLAGRLTMVVGSAAYRALVSA